MLSCAQYGEEWRLFWRLGSESSFVLLQQSRRFGCSPLLPSQYSPLPSWCAHILVQLPPNDRDNPQLAVDPRGYPSHISKFPLHTECAVNAMESHPYVPLRDNSHRITSLRENRGGGYPLRLRLNPARSRLNPICPLLRSVPLRENRAPHLAGEPRHDPTDR